MSPRPKLPNGDECPHEKCPFDEHILPKVYNGKPASAWQTNGMFIIALVVGAFGAATFAMNFFNASDKFVQRSTYAMDEEARRESRDVLRAQLASQEARLARIEDNQRAIQLLLGELIQQTKGLDK